MFEIKIDVIAVKGKSEGVAIYTVLQPDRYNRLEFANARTMHNKMFKYYCKQEWAFALTHIMELKGCFDGVLDYYYDMMIQRIADYELSKKLPRDWNGTFVATSK